MDDILLETEMKMEAAIESMEKRFANVRAGRANPNILSGLMVNYYDNPTPIQALATISILEARQLAIKPFDKSAFKEIEKSIYAAELGMAPTNNGEMIILTIPELTEETRKVYVKQVKDMSEEARIALRNVRQDTNNWIKKQEFSENEEDVYLETAQKLTDKYNGVIEENYKDKEKELMSI